jgi:DNA-binding PadR family transcriptional regulator
MKKSQTLAAFDVMCLVAVIACGANAYGIPIHKGVKKLVSPLRSIALSAVYRTLRLLERKGVVSSRYGGATPERGGRAKRYFRVTAAGRQSLQKALKPMRHALEVVEGSRSRAADWDER